MLRLLGFVIRVLLFSLTVLVLSNWIHWRGRTVSDQVRMHLAHAEHAPWAEEIGEKAHSEWKGWVDWVFDHAWGPWETHGTRAKPRAVREPIDTARARVEAAADEAPARKAAPQELRSKERLAETAEESLPASERQKLKALIQELNGSHGRD